MGQSVYKKEFLFEKLREKISSDLFEKIIYELNAEEWKNEIFEKISKIEEEINEQSPFENDAEYVFSASKKAFNLFEKNDEEVNLVHIFAYFIEKQTS